MGIEEIVGIIIIEGGKYLLKRLVDEAGKEIWRAFADEDGDYVPDDPFNPFREWDEDPGGWEPLPELPVEPEPAQISIIIVNPDGTMTIYDTAGNITEEVVDTAQSLWVSKNGALDKPFNYYSVSEALLLPVAVASVVTLFCKIFKRRKF